MKTKAQMRREAAKETERLAREAALVRQQAFIDHRTATEGSILNTHTDLVLEHLMWPYNQPRRPVDFERMRSPRFQEAVLGAEAEHLVVLMDYIETNPAAGVDPRVVASTCVSGFDYHGEPETFYRIEDGGQTFYFSTSAGTHRMVDRQFFRESATSLREEADRIEDFSA